MANNQIFYFVISEYYKCGEFAYWDEIAFVSKKQAKHFATKYRNGYPFGNVKIYKITAEKIRRDSVERGWSSSFSLYRMEKHQPMEIVEIKL